jgi:hypothetical protein
VAATNGTRKPDRFEIAARTWVARDRIMTDCEEISRRSEAVSTADYPHDLELRYRLDQMHAANLDQDEAAWLSAVADFLEECVVVRDRLGASTPF